MITKFDNGRNIGVLVNRPIIVNQSHNMERIIYNDDDTVIHFGYLNKTIGYNYSDWKKHIYEAITVSNIDTKADVVVLGVGNADLYNLRQSPTEFAKGFMLLINYMINLYGDQQTFIIKTTQWRSGKYYGKSDAFANVIRSITSNLNDNRVLLWDTHQFGMKENALTEYTVRLENSLLERMFCKIPAHYYA